MTHEELISRAEKTCTLAELWDAIYRQQGLLYGLFKAWDGVGPIGDDGIGAEYTHLCVSFDRILQDVLTAAQLPEVRDGIELTELAFLKLRWNSAVLIHRRDLYERMRVDLDKLHRRLVNLAEKTPAEADDCELTTRQTRDFLEQKHDGQITKWIQGGKLTSNGMSGRECRVSRKSAEKLKRELSRPTKERAEDQAAQKKRAAEIKRANLRKQFDQEN